MRTKFIIAVVITLVVMGLAKIITDTNTEVHLRRLDIKTKQSEINHLETKIEKYDSNNQQTEEELQQLKEENDKLQQELQAKLDRQAEDARNAVYAAEIKVKPAPAPAVVTATGSWVDRCHAWAAQAGMTLNASAIKLLERESKCSPTAWNASSGAGGIPQALPFSKTGCRLELTDSAAVCQLQWFQTYVFNRYGSYDAALAHSFANNWY